MKKKLLLFTLLLCNYITTAQTTYVPDDGLESRLIQLGLDSGPLDNYVFTANINTLEDFKFLNFTVTDITGLQDFTALKELRVNGQIADLSPIENLVNLEELALSDITATSLELSALVNLEYIYITDTALTSLDFSNNSNLLEASIETSDVNEVILSNNPLLDDIAISGTNISTLDLSSCVAITYAIISYNSSLISLNISQSPLLEVLQFNNNTSIPYLDLSANVGLLGVYATDNTALETIYIKNGNNTNIGQTFRVRDNPSLMCVEVDDVSWSNTFWGFATNNFQGFSLNCSPQNDDCAQATSITLAQPASGTTQSATNSTNTPSCQETGITIVDVWYEFVAPASGSVTMTISANPLIAKIAFYNSCSDAQPAFCAEGELSVDNLTPNTTYYLQVWLEVDLMNRQPTPENANGGFILNVQDTSTLGVNDVTNDTNQIRMYPNPAKDMVTVSAKSTIEEISIYDVSGKQILKNNNGTTNELNLNLLNLTDGLYLVQIKTANTTITKKLLIN
jgi:hypothetical protein